MRKAINVRPQLDGLLLIDKPGGWTSHDVVAYVRGRYHLRKVGHAGTLDPLATGLLILGLEFATRSLARFAAEEKEYVVGLLLGRRTSTGDIEGEVIEEGGGEICADAIVDAIRSFVGEVEQVPPIYSAIKYKGRPLYSYARKGEDVPRKARRVRIMEIEILEVDFPNVLFRAVVSKGTYIRTLCEDIGDKLGCPSTMFSLRRTRIGNFSIQDAITIEELKRMDRDALQEALIEV